ncbi:MAG: FG-GAP repeat protein, partial [Candidatus Latescibacterota bacterium]
SMYDDGLVDSAQKISDDAGNFTGTLADGDYFGTSLAAIGDLNGDGVNDMAVGAIGDDGNGSPPDADRGAVWVLYLQSDRTVDTWVKIDDFTFLVPLFDENPLANNDSFGYSITQLGDLDGDGVVDLGVGAMGDDTGGADRGAVWLLFLHNDGGVKTYEKITSDNGLGGSLANGDNFGSSLALLGDIDIDGTQDIVVGATGDDSGGDGVGATWTLFLYPPDTDGDGVYYTEDLCESDDASYFDRDGDG